MPTTIIIPSRMYSTRLPGKPMKLVKGIPLVKRVYDACRETGLDTYVATDSMEIGELIQNDAQVIMTPTELRTGSDRVAHAAKQLGLSDDDLVVNVQGDLPFVSPALIFQMVYWMKFSGCKVATPAIRDESYKKGRITIAATELMKAVYFSRSPIPHQTTDKESYFHHIGLYVYRNSVLQQFASLPNGLLEDAESLEQLRFLENNLPIDIVETTFDPKQEINTQGDLDRVNNNE